MLKSIPLETTLQFEGNSLRNLFIPPVPKDPKALEVLFDLWVYALGEGEQKARGDLCTTYGGERLSLFMEKETELGGQAVLLLFALGHAADATLTYGEDFIFVEKGGTRFGIENGLVLSPFCTGVELNVKPTLTLTQDRVLQTTDHDFISLYREAYKVGGGLTEVLTALLMRAPNFNFRRVATGALGLSAPSLSGFERIENALQHPENPVGTLYKILVPRWMTPPQFRQILVKSGSKEVPFSADQRFRQMHQIHTFFYHLTE